MIDLRQVEKYIDAKLRSLDSNADKMLIAALDKIKLHIENYKKSENAHYLLEIRRLIESIKLAPNKNSFSLFRSNDDTCTFMGTSLAKRNFYVISKPNEREQICKRNGIPDLTLSLSAEGIFGWIYQTITQKLPVSTIEWEATFAKNQSGKITSDEILAWQAGMQDIEIPLKAVRDFRRDIKILDKDPTTYSSDEDAIEQLDELIQQSTYTDEEKMYIKPWLLAKGGQEMNFFITDMIDKQSLLRVPESMLSQQHENILSTRSFATDNNWSLDKEGKIVYYQNMHVRQIINGSDCVLARKPNGEVNIIRSNEPEFDLVFSQKSQNDSNCLISINSHARLDISEGIVKPTILSLNIISQTNTVSPPANSKPTALTSATAATAATASDTPHLHRPNSSKF